MRAFHEQRKYPSGHALPVELSHPVDMQFRAHWHGQAEIICVEEGSLRVGVNHQVATLEQGDMAIIGSGDIHFYERTQGGSKTTMIIFSPAVVGLPAGWPEKGHFSSPFIHAGATPASRLLSDRLISVFAQLEDSLRVKQGGQIHFIKSLIHQICGWCERDMRLAPAGSQPELNRLDRIVRMQHVLDYMELHYREDLSLNSLATQMNISYSHFSRLFSDAVGMPFRSFLNAIRLSEADRLLTSTAMSVTDIAMQCGFGSLRTFNRVYREERNTSPSRKRS